MTHDRHTFSTTARQQVRSVLELAAHRSAENASRVATELASLATQADALGLGSIAELARRGSDQARSLDRDHTAVSACARTLRDLARAIDALARESAAPRKVLVIDDSSLNASVVCDALERAGFTTNHVEDAKSAVAAITRFAPDVVLIDVQMPDTTPVELCARLRAAAASKIQLVLFSGLSDAELVELQREAGADGYVSKEHGLEAVVRKVTSSFARAG
jgi:CheY-like chemotaxis protein